MFDLDFKYYPDPLLRRKAEPVELVDGKPPSEILNLIEQMKHVCVKEDGIGLAAHQLGVVLPVFITAFKNGRDKYNMVGVVNPKVLKTGGNFSMYEEGCLSFPELYIPILRASELLVEGWFDDSEKFEQRIIKGFESRIFLHETDHTDGILIIDRTDEKTRFKIKKDLKRIAQKFGKLSL